MIRENQGSKQGRGHNDHGSAELGTGGAVVRTLRWFLPFSARVHPPHSTRHQRPSLRDTTSFQCPSAILHRLRRVVHLHSKSDICVSTAFPSLSFSDVFVYRHSPNRYFNLTSRLPLRIQLHPRGARCRHCVDLPLPVFNSGFDATADYFTYVSRSDDAILQNRMRAIRASVHGGARAPCVAQSYHGMTLHDML